MWNTALRGCGVCYVATAQRRNDEPSQRPLRGGRAMNAYMRIAGLAFLASSAMPVFAQDAYPTKVIRIVTPATGGGSDVLARMISPGLTAAFGQQVIVDNRG